MLITTAKIRLNSGPTTPTEIVSAPMGGFADLDEGSTFPSRDWSLLSGTEILRRLEGVPDTTDTRIESKVSSTQVAHTMIYGIWRNNFHELEAYPSVTITNSIAKHWETYRGLGMVSYEEPILIKDFERLKERITALCSIDDVDSPNSDVEKAALGALEYCFYSGFLPSLINATGDESLLFEFFTGDSTFAIEFYNSGELIFLQRHPDEVPKVDEIEPVELQSALARIADVYALTESMQ